MKVYAVEITEWTADGKIHATDVEGVFGSRERALSCLQIKYPGGRTYGDYKYEFDVNSESYPVARVSFRITEHLFHP